MVRRLPLALAALALVTTASSANAQSAPRKLARGVAGVSLALVEIPANVAAETDARGLALGPPVGFARGIGMMLPRILVGVYDIVTSPFPLPAGYQPIMQPEFPWGYFQDGWAETAEGGRR
jgi:putative exosortase-associated protein (TIGR04073 family)